jgi:ribosomal protein S18 acetylase RimI-like enzyme
VNTVEVALRPLTSADEPFLLEMLREADRWQLPVDAPRPPLAEILADPHVALYVQGWGRPGDDGVLAESGDEPIGACWLRLFTEESHGWGYVAPDVPELSLAVAPLWRRRGVGRLLVSGAVTRARKLGCAGVSLSVMPDNPARRLYESLGFLKVADVDGSWTMLSSLGAET